MVPARYSEGPLFRKSTVQIRVTVLKLGLELALGSRLVRVKVRARVRVGDRVRVSKNRGLSE